MKVNGVSFDFQSRGIGMTDEQLLLGAQNAEKQGDSAEHKKYAAMLIARYIPLIKARAAYFKSSSVERDDLISEGFLGLLGAIRSYDAEKGTFAAFASTCISNKMKTAVSKNGGNYPERVSMDEAKLEEIGDESPSAEELLIQKEQYDEIEKMTESLLSKREKDVFMLYLSAYSYAQIAEKLGISAKAVDNALSRAKAKLRSAMAG